MNKTERLRAAARNPRAQESTYEAAQGRYPESTPDALLGGDKQARDAALRTIDQWEGSLTPEAADRLDWHVRTDRQGLDSAYIAAVSSDEYESAFRKRLMDPQGGHHSYTPAESAAVNDVRQIEAERSLAVGSGPAGAFAIPFSLDPSILNISDGRVNPLRELAQVDTISTTTWQGVSSEGVAASWYDENEEVGDDTPILVQPEITPQRMSIFVPFSVEAGNDWPSLQSEMATLFADARDELEAEAFTSGTASNSPEGILTGGTITVSGGGTIVADTYLLQQALPPRYQPRATFLSSNARQNDTYRAVASADTDEPPLVSEDRSRILGRPWREVSHMSDGPTGKVAVYADVFSGYRVIDRLGGQIELVSHLFGSSRRPTGQRGLFYIARVGAKVVNPSAIRVLDVS